MPTRGNVLDIGGDREGGAGVITRSTVYAAVLLALGFFVLAANSLLACSTAVASGDARTCEARYRVKGFVALGFLVQSAGFWLGPLLVLRARVLRANTSENPGPWSWTFWALFGTYSLGSLVFSYTTFYDPGVHAHVVIAGNFTQTGFPVIPPAHGHQGSAGPAGAGNFQEIVFQATGDSGDIPEGPGLRDTQPVNTEGVARSPTGPGERRRLVTCYEIYRSTQACGFGRLGHWIGLDEYEERRCSPATVVSSTLYGAHRNWVLAQALALVLVVLGGLGRLIRRIRHCRVTNVQPGVFRG